jgi:molybdopterin-guanine dinucleotide biosynthesis protein A
MSMTGKLLGVVLCGGESRRMGRDKGLLQTDGRPWVLRMGDKLSNHQLPVVYSINKRQVSAYSTWLPAEQVVVDSDRGAGPLKGLLSVHRCYPDSHLLPVACDMQDLDAATIAGIISTWLEGGADLYAYEVEGFLQPFCAIYGAGALTRGEGSASLRELLQCGALRRLKGTEAAFRNYNSL